MQAKYGERGLVVVGITQDVPERAEWFRGYREATYPILASAEEDFDAYGVVWVPVVYLIDPGDRIVADDLDEIETVLARELGS